MWSFSKKKPIALAKPLLEVSKQNTTITMKCDVNHLQLSNFIFSYF